MVGTESVDPEGQDDGADFAGRKFSEVVLPRVGRTTRSSGIASPEVTMDLLKSEIKRRLLYGRRYSAPKITRSAFSTQPKVYPSTWRLR